VKKCKFAILIFLSHIILFFNSCTIIGFGVGAIIDKNRSNYHSTINEELFSISPGTIIKLITITGDTLTGIYHSTTNEYSLDYITEYNKKYEMLREQLLIPKIYDTLLISNPLGDIFKYIFLGFDYKKIYVKSTLSNNKLLIKLNSNLNIKANNDTYLDHTLINNVFELKLIPMISKINIKKNKDINSIFYHNIHSIQTKSKNRKRWLVLIGATIDYIIYSQIDNFNIGDGIKWK
jgi:hypothetical protein